MSKIIPYRKGTRWGYSDSNGKIVIDCLYDKVNEFVLDNEVLDVKKDGENILINRSGSIVARGFETYQLGEKDNNLLVITRTILQTKRVKKGTADFDSFPKEP